jgi:predicted NodU family carbamoyl transferase
MTAVLGISAFYHDSAACLVIDGEIVAAAQEERFTRTKHDPGFPANACRYCLAEAGLKLGDLTLVGFYEKPLTKFDRLLDTYLDYAPRGWGSFIQAIPLWMKEKLWVGDTIRRELANLEEPDDPKAARKLAKSFPWKVMFGDHHESHAASAFYPSPFEEAAIITVDGVGEWATASLGTGRGSDLRLFKELRFPDSLGLLYSALTYFTGFKVNSGEYKVMGLAPYGEPRHLPLLRERIARICDDGSIHLDQSYFNYCEGLTMTGRRFDKAVGGRPREQESDLTQREMDLARSVQDFTDEAMLKLARFAHAETGMKHLAMAGGVALNQGRMEFGPRALGSRSILGDARSPKMQSVMNLKIKYRESFRPFAPSVLSEHVHEWFELDRDSPYMLNVPRSSIPAVTHVDHSARIQTVRRDTNPLYWDIIEAFRLLTGCAVIVNTSFNVRGEPIVCSPDDAYRCFMRTEMDALVLEECLLLKEEQPTYEDRENWREQFTLD